MKVVDLSRPAPKVTELECQRCREESMWGRLPNELNRAKVPGEYSRSCDGPEVCFPSASAAE